MLVSKLLVLRGCKKTMPANWRSRVTFAFCCLPVLLLTILWVPLSAAQATEGAGRSPSQSATENAAPTAQPAPAHRAHSTYRRVTLDDRVKSLAKALDLSDTQQVAVKRILEQRQAETLRLRLDGSISGEQRIDRWRALQDDTVLRIRAVLNDDQKKKYDPLAIRERTPPQDQKTVEEWLKETTPKTAPAQHE
jgi:CBS-domain-containing membrane protein